MNIVLKKTNEKKILFGDLIYRESEYSFDFNPHPFGGITSFLINDLNLELDEEGNVLYVWGLAPKTMWKATNNIPSHFVQAGLQCINAKVRPGISIRINKNYSWPVFFNKTSNWIFIGEDINYQGLQLIEFAQNSVAVLSDAGELKGLWLRPMMIP